jgi:hypothetical protein
VGSWASTTAPMIVAQAGRRQSISANADRRSRGHRELIQDVRDDRRADADRDAGQQPGGVGKRMVLSSEVRRGR